MRLDTSGGGKGSFAWRCAGGQQAKELGSAGLKHVFPYGSLPWVTSLVPQEAGSAPQETQVPLPPMDLGPSSIAFLQKYQAQ